MGTQFSVDAAELRRTARQAFALYNELSESSLPAHALDGIAGDGHVDDAYSGFVNHWSDGLLRIRQQLSDLSERLAAAADGYATTDQQISQAASGGGPARSARDSG